MDFLNNFLVEFHEHGFAITNLVVSALVLFMLLVGYLFGGDKKERLEPCEVAARLLLGAAGLLFLTAVATTFLLLFRVFDYTAAEGLWMVPIVSSVFGVVAVGLAMASNYRRM
jgi:hypothetical protein